MRLFPSHECFWVFWQPNLWQNILGNTSKQAVSKWKVTRRITLKHRAGTSTDSDKCDLSKDSDMAPLTLGSMDNTTYFISHRKPI